MSSTPLPPLFSRWLDELLGEPIPAESRATCADCAMCKPREQSAGEALFRPDVKCCAYTPTLANFLVGRILANRASDASWGRSIVARRIARREGSTPLGLGPGPAYWEAQGRMCKAVPHEFGRRPDLICPYFVKAGGLCSIWHSRDAVCATYFCLHDRAALGQRFWTTVREALQTIEAELALWCAHQVGIDASALQELFDGAGHARSLAKRELRGWVEPDGRCEPALYARLWGGWSGREEEFHLACADQADALSWSSLQRVLGPRLESAATRLRAAFRAFSAVSTRRAPRALTLAVLEESDGEAGQVVLRSHEIPHESVVVGAELYQALREFDGESTEASLGRIGEGHGVALDADTLRLLVERGVLIEPDGRDALPRLQSAAPVAEHDVLRFFRAFQDAEVILEQSVDDAGVALLTVSCGMRQVSFDEPECFAFARELVAHQNGFRAGDAVAWCRPGEALEWSKVADMLQALLEAGVLQRISQSRSNAVAAGDPLWLPQVDSA